MSLITDLEGKDLEHENLVFPRKVTGDPRGTIQINVLFQEGYRKVKQQLKKTWKIVRNETERTNKSTHKRSRFRVFLTEFGPKVC